MNTQAFDLPIDQILNYNLNPRIEGVDDSTADKFESLARTLVKASSLIRGSR